MENVSRTGTKPTPFQQQLFSIAGSEGRRSFAVQNLLKRTYDFPISHLFGGTVFSRPPRGSGR